MSKQYMWRSKLIILAALLYFAGAYHSTAQNMEEDSLQNSLQDSTVVIKKVIEVGFAFDYLKLHTLALDDREKWEAAANITLFNHYSFIAELGTASLSPDDAYDNADYTSEGNYYRVGFDYQFNINPTNLFMLGLRYAAADYTEDVSFATNNPLFGGQSGEVYREELFAQWYELVISSEKMIKRIFKQDIKDILSLGFKFRLKSFLDNPQFDYVETKYIPGYGGTINKINPEVNLYLKLRIPVLKR